MPFDEEDEQQPEQPDLIAQAMRAAMPMRTGEATSSGPMPQPAAPSPALAPALSTDNLLRHAMSSGAKLSPNDAPPPSVALPPPSPAMVKPVVDQSKTMPPAPNGGIRLSELIQQRAQAGTPIDRSDPKYKISKGGRVMRGIADLLSGGVPALGQDLVDPTRKGYIGKGAPNAQYTADLSKQAATTKNLDTEIAGTEKLNTENESLFRDATRQAYESQIGQARQDTSQAQKDAAAARQTAADASQQRADQANREITYDAKTKRFLQNGKTYLPKTVEEGASLEAGNGIEGHYSKLWNAERKNQPQQPRTPQLSAKDNLRLTAAAKELGKSVDEMTDEEINKALFAPRTAGAKKDNTKAVSDAIERKNGDLQAEETKFKKRWDAANKDGAAKEDLDQLTKEHEDRKNEVLGTYSQKVQVLDPDGSIQARISQGPAQPQAAPQQPAAQPAPAPVAQPAAAKPQGAPQRKVNDIVPTKRGMMKITKILPNGKYEGIPAP